MSPKLGDKVVYHGVAFALKSWPVRRLVRPGTEGTVVAEYHQGVISGLGDDGKRWTVDFGQCRVVIIRGFDKEYRRA